MGAGVAAAYDMVSQTAARFFLCHAFRRLRLLHKGKVVGRPLPAVWRPVVICRFGQRQPALIQEEQARTEELDDGLRRGRSRSRG